MKTIQLTKILNFKRTLAAAAFALAALAYATPGQAMPHFVTFDFSGPGACSASIYEVAAKFSACNLKAEAKAAKRGVEPNLAACDAKVARWAKKSEKACCSDSISDPEEHEACVDALDTAIVETGISTCEAGPSDRRATLKQARSLVGFSTRTTSWAVAVRASTRCWIQPTKASCFVVHRRRVAARISLSDRAAA